MDLNPRRNAPAVLMSLLILSAGQPALYADCDDDPANLLSARNCGFDSDITGWDRMAGDNPAWLSNVGDPELGALQMGDSVLAPLSSYTATLASSCAPTSGGVAVGYGARLLRLSGGAVQCSVGMETFSDGSCATPTGSATTTTGPGVGAFLLIASSHTTNPAAASTRLIIQCTDPVEGFQIALDNAFIGEGLTVPVELQSFSVE